MLVPANSAVININVITAKMGNSCLMFTVLLSI